uniref:Uncharacterized protein n=1 Tax=Solanum tuberosum TaxID=4113 RepID=M1DUC1_SOLTU
MSRVRVLGVFSRRDKLGIRALDFEKLQVQPNGCHPRTVGQTIARAGGLWFTTAIPHQTHLRISAKSRPTDKPTVRRSDHGLWSVSMDRGPLFTQPLMQTTADQHGPSFDPRPKGPVRRSLRQQLTTVTLGDPNHDRRILPRIAFCILFRSSACVQIFFSNLWRPDCPSPNRSATRQLAQLLVEISLNLALAFCNFWRYHGFSAIRRMLFSVVNVVTSSRT